MLARVSRLQPFEDLTLVGNHAERFSMDPDEVFWKCSMETVIAFAIEQKERQEFKERFTDLYQQLNDTTSDSNTTGKHSGRD